MSQAKFGRVLEAEIPVMVLQGEARISKKHVDFAVLDDKLERILMQPRRE